MVVKDSHHTYIDLVAETIEGLTRYGVKGFYCSQKTIDILESWKKSPSIKKDRPSETTPFEKNNRRSLSVKQPKRHVVARGNRDSRLVFIAPWPDYEDLSRLPYSGEMGVLFSKILSAMKLSQKDRFMFHIISNQPTDKTILPPEMHQQVVSSVDQHIHAHHPEVICTLGEMVSSLFLPSGPKDTFLRGKFHQYKGVKVMPSLHPFELLMHPHKKRDVWDDMKMIMNVLNISI